MRSESPRADRPKGRRPPPPGRALRMSYALRRNVACVMAIVARSAQIATGMTEGMVVAVVFAEALFDVKVRSGPKRRRRGQRPTSTRSRGLPRSASNPTRRATIASRPSRSLARARYSLSCSFFVACRIGRNECHSGRAHQRRSHALGAPRRTTYDLLWPQASRLCPFLPDGNHLRAGGCRTDASSAG